MDQGINYPFKTDHEFLIALIADFNNSMRSVNTKIGDDHRTTLEVKKLLVDQQKEIADRLEIVEEALNHLNPKEIASTVQWVKDFNRAKHLAWIAGSGIFFALGYFLSNLYYFIGIFHK